MKTFKYLILAFFIGLLWSCQTQEAFNDEAVTSKKAPLSDGRPSEADDQYDFDKTKYYHNNELISDTTTIKAMLSQAKALHVAENGTDKHILLSENEKTSFYRASDGKNASNSRATAALDGDNYLHYFYEVTLVSPVRGSKSKDYGHDYFSVIGPKTYDTSDLNGTEVSQYSARDAADPTFVKNVTIATGAINSLLSNLLYRTFRTEQSRNFTINVINPTRFKRRVTFTSTTGRILTRDISPAGTISLNGSYVSGVSKFNALTFKIASHTSDKI